MGMGGGDVFAGYTVERVLRTEYGGQEYRVAHPRLPRSDVLWVFPPDWSANSEFSSRFADEADLASMLDHPDIVGVRDRGEYDGQLWIAFEHVIGTDAADLLRDEHPDGLPPDQVVQIVTAVAEALDHAHDRGVLHGGVGPSRIITANGGRTARIMLTDFALSRLLEGDQVSPESVAYSAPELLTDQPYDGRTDQYALAATAYHLLTGAPPFAHPNPAVVISRHLGTPAPILAATHPHLTRFDEALTCALAKDPDDRYPTCAEFAAALGREQAASDPGPPAPPSVTTPERELSGPPVYQSDWGKPKPTPVPKKAAKPVVQQVKTAPARKAPAKPPPKAAPAPAKPQPKEVAPKTTVPTRTEADFWTDAGIDPIRIVLDDQTLFTLRCYVDDQAYFLGRRRKIRTFTTRQGLIHHLATATDHDLVDLITFPAVSRAAAADEIALPVSPKNTYRLTGVAATVEDGVEAIDGARLEMAADLALDVGDYTGDDTMVGLCRPESPVYELVSAVSEGNLRRVAQYVRIAAASDWRVLEDRMMAHLRADVR
jgi:serine/threonine protein kinase